MRARVQMIISSLQGDRATRGRSQERALHRGPRGREALPAASPASAACGLAAEFDPRREADAGPPAPDSDSDDSVDRDIEAAIQEYLKARGGATRPTAADGERLHRPEPPQSSAPPAPCAPRLAPGSGGAPGSHVGAGRAPGSASPLSVSSEDSFEQSIRAEIEQFLNEKRQHETPRRDTPADKKPDPGDSVAKPAIRPCKEPSVKAQRQESAGTCKEFVFRKPPRLAKAAAQPRSLRPKASPQPESPGGPKPAAPRLPATGRPAEAQSKGGARRNPGPGRRGQGAKSAALAREASDSSSDDGIEEAIQRYQLEKRKEAGGPPPGEEPPEPPARGPSHHATRSALPETHRRTPGRRKPVSSKALDLGPGGPDPDHPPRPPKETKAPAPPGNTPARSEAADGASCQADASAELMCAEAILDISKTILPAPGEGGARLPASGPPPRPPRVPSRSDGDSSSVDSDDSIEREIRTFLALKAQSGTSLARTEPRPQTAQGPPPPPGPHGQAGGPKAPASRTLGLSLSRTRKRRGGSATTWSSTPKKVSEVAKGGALDSDPGQGRAREASGREGEAQAQPPTCRTAGLDDEHAAPDAPGGVPPSPGKAAESRSEDEKGSSEDKSSSLDSDEDLDSAIKDLLRSKRRLKKRCRDPRAACRKKVRLGTGEARAPGPQGGLRRGWRAGSPHLLKGCLSRDGREGPARKPSGVFCSGTERAKPGGVGPTDSPPALPPGRRACRGHGCSGEAGAGHLPGTAAGPGSRPEDSSSVDSDDSIELEIRKFLAEKAKESVSGSETPGGGPTPLGPGGAPRPEPPGRKAAAPALALQPGVCTRSQRGRGTPQPASGPRGGPHVKQACLPAAPSRGQRAPPRSTSEAVSARGPPAGRRNLYPHRDQSARGAGPATGDGAFGQPSSCAEAGTGGLGGTSPVTSRGRSTPTRSLGADREGGPQAGLALPWGDFAHQRRLQSAWALGSDGRDAAWKGGLGGEREKAAEGPARGAPGLATDPKKGLPFAGLSPLRPTQLFPFGNSVAWGATPAGLFGPGLGLPLQGPSFSAFREAPAGPGPVFGGSHLLVKKEGGRWPGRKAPARLGFRDGRTSGSDEDVLDLRYSRRADRDPARDQEAWGSDASELSDTSVEDGGPVAPGKALKL